MNRSFWISSAVTLCCLIGCGSSGDEWTAKRPAVVPASGKLTFNGGPVEGATISLAPDPPRDGVPGAFAVTDSDGEFELITFPPDAGVVPGKYKVSVTKVEAAAAAPDSADHDQPRSKSTAKALLPPKFADAATSGLMLDIPEGGKTDITLDLK